MKLHGIVLWLIAALISAALLSSVMYSFYDKTVKSKPVIPPYDIFWCSTDDQCSVVDRIGCCTCEESGGQAAVTRWHRDDLRLFLKKACRPRQVCVQVDVCRNDVQAKCIKRRCQLVPKEKHGE